MVAQLKQPTLGAVSSGPLAEPIEVEGRRRLLGRRYDDWGRTAQELVLLRHIGGMTRPELARRAGLSERETQNVLTNGVAAHYTQPVLQVLAEYGICQPGGAVVERIDALRGIVALYRDLLAECIDWLAADEDEAARALARRCEAFGLLWRD